MAATNAGPRRPLIPLLLSAGYALLLAAWIFANPPFAAPDEAGHYLRAIGLGDGRLIGERSGYRDPGLSAKQAAFSRQTARRVAVPAGLAPDFLGCNADLPEQSAACQYAAAPPQREEPRATHVGAYQPLPYLLPAAVIRAGDDPGSADRYGRVAGAALVFALLAGAIFALWDRRVGALSLLGLAAAVTPMVLFMGSVVNGSGLEIVAGIAFVASLLRLFRDEGAPRWILPFAAVSGCLLALSRPLGPAWIALAVLLVIALEGWGVVRHRFRRAGKPAWGAAGAVLLAVAVNRLWEARYGADLHVGVNPFPSSLRLVYDASKRIVPEVIGNFGVLDTRLPAAGLALGYLLIATLVALALWRAADRERVVLVAAIAVAIALPGVVHALVYRHTGFWIQGRYFMPILLAVPLLAGELVLRHAERLTPAWRRWLPIAITLGAALLQVGGWFVNARRHAVGTDGAAWFLDAAEWSPPLGWTAWAVVVVTGGLALVAAGLLHAFGEEPLRRGRRAGGDRLETPRSRGTAGIR